MALPQPGSHADQNAPHKEGHALRDQKQAGVGARLALIPDNWGRKNERERVSFCCTVVNNRSHFVPLLKKGKFPSSFATVPMLESNQFPPASSMDH